MKFRKLPLEVEAFNFDGEIESYQYIKKRFPNMKAGPYVFRSFEICSEAGKVKVFAGDWVIKGACDEYYPMKPQAFVENFIDIETPLTERIDELACIKAIAK